MPADVFEKFRDKCIEIYELDPAHFFSAPGLAWQACLKKTKVKLELLTNINMLFMVEKGISGGICQAIHRHAKVNNNYMKNYDMDRQFVWIGDVAKITSKWFQMGRKNEIIKT